MYTRISTLNQHHVEATLAVLKAMDSLATEAAVPRMTEKDFHAMRQANSDFAAAVKRQDVTKALAADDAFHRVVLKAADNPIAARIIEQLHPSLHRILYRKFADLLGGEETIKHHAKLIRVCGRRETPRLQPECPVSTGLIWAISSAASSTPTNSPIRKCSNSHSVD